MTVIKDTLRGLAVIGAFTAVVVGFVLALTELFPYSVCALAVAWVLVLAWAVGSELA